MTDYYWFDSFDDVVSELILIYVPPRVDWSVLLDDIFFKVSGIGYLIEDAFCGSVHVLFYRVFEVRVIFIC